ncbi:S41 family peptidase [Hazenella sp. IB182353]|uniref:S41 family peptidase n=1 Tax=Polycladospora coralii TaxID=2771432 RepID=UPI0017460254|nr:S41 family peptidase [Polycladospora coralii]MBS7528999.1 S41 family peptidase [Polycladospora coralii]
MEQRSEFNSNRRIKVLDELIQLLIQHYVCAHKAKKIANHLTTYRDTDHYQQLTTANQFCTQLTHDLQEWSQDLHLKVFYSSKNDGDKKRRIQETNYGFYEVKLLAGNIGYMDIRSFSDPEHAGDLACSAMHFLTHTEALIIDLRHHTGGHPAMVQLLCSYFFPSFPILHLNDQYFRSQKQVESYWTLPYVPGKRYLKKPVYVLISKETFSGAEEFAYNLKHLNRATLVGETTKGGAHPCKIHKLSDSFNVLIPHGESINPITKTNWEGTGVTPHIKTPSERAFDTAYQLAVKHLQHHLEHFSNHLQTELKQISLGKSSL